MVTTLVLSRRTGCVFGSSLFDDQWGRFGTMIVLQGGEVTDVDVSPPGAATATGSGGISGPTGTLDITTSDGGAVSEISRYTTIERWGGYVQLKPQRYNGKTYKDGAYGLRYEDRNTAVIQLGGTNGHCFRVLGGVTEKERAILIHEAPHVGWLTGCIGPRAYEDYALGNTTTSHTAMLELFALRPRPTALFVLDW